MKPLLVARIHPCSLRQTARKYHLQALHGAFFKTSNIANFSKLPSCQPPPQLIVGRRRSYWQASHQRSIATSVSETEAHSPTPTTKPADSIYTTSTHRLLHSPIGSFDPRAWHEAQWTIHWWLKHRSVESVRVSFQLQDRCMEEYIHGQCGEHDWQSVPAVMSTEVLNAVINNWRLCAKRMKSTKERSQLPTPTDILKKLDHYYESNQDSTLKPLQPNVQTYSMVMDALAFGQQDVVVGRVDQRMAPKSHSSTRNTAASSWDNVQAPVVAESILEWLMEQSKVDCSLKPTIVTINSVIHAWARSGFPNAARKAEGWLRWVMALSDKDLAPHAATYGSVIYAWSNSNAKDAATHSEKLLQEMIDSKAPHLTPTSVIYVGVLKAYGRARTKEAAEHANQILQTLVQRYQEEQQQRGRESDNQFYTAKPNLQTFLVVMNAFAQQSDAQRASGLLRQLQDLYETSGRDPDFCPNAAAFNCVLKAWSRSKSPGAAIQSEKILQHMYTLAATTGNKSLLPDVISYNMVLHAFATTGGQNALERIEEILQTMFDTQGVSPNIYSFNSILHCWAQSNRADAAENAESILRRMWKLFQDGKIDFRPDFVSYNTCMAAWSRSNDKQAVDRAEALFRELHLHYQESGDRNLQPTRTSYGTLIAITARGKNGAAAERLVNEMIERGILPTNIEYNAAIHAAAVNGKPARAEALLSRMFDDFSGGNAKAKPDVKSFSAVLNAFAKVRSKDPFACAKRAESVLQRMEELRAILGDEVKPNTFSFNSVMDCFAKCSGNSTAAAHAEKLLRHMQALHEAGDADVKPNVVSFTIVMNSWVKSHAVDAAFRAETLFRELRELYAKTNDPTLRPTQHTYNAMLTAYAKSANKESVDKALKVFEELISYFKESGDLNLRPSPMHYSAIINAYAKCGMAEEADTFLQRVTSDTDCIKVSGDLSTSFNALIGAYARSKDPQCGTKAEQTLRRMYEMHPSSTPGQRIYAVPNVISYTSVLLAWSRTQSRVEREVGLARSESLLHEMLSLADKGVPQIMPNQRTFGTLLEVIFHSSAEDKGERARQVLQTMKRLGVHADDYCMRMAQKCCRDLKENE